MASSKSAQFVKAIRQGHESDEFSLAGFDAKQVNLLIRDAFTEPIPTPQMLRFSFLVGGGKNVRSKYYANLPRDMTAALKGISYSEDRSASLCLESQATFKYQHNTDTDLKTITVFPRVKILECKKDEGPKWMVDGHNVIGTPAELVCSFCTMLNFVQLVVELCPTFSQRVSLLEALKRVQVDIESIEAKYAQMKPLSPQEEALYNDVVSLPEKITALTTQTENMVYNGQLTPVEREEMIVKLSAKRETLMDQEHKLQTKIKKKAKSASKKSKSRLSKLTAAIDRMSETLESLEAKRQTSNSKRKPRKAPPTPYQKKIDEKLSSLYKRRNNSLQTLTDVEDEIHLLEFKRAGWFPRKN